MEIKHSASRVIAENKALSGKTAAICDEIETRLLRGQYRFGQEILVNDLVKEFGASRAPVMAALNHLRAEGYLVITPQVGCKVISPTLSEIEDFVFVFSRVEGAIASMAAKRHYANEIAHLDATQQKIKRIAPKKGQQITEPYVDLIAEFHRRIHDMCHSQFAGDRATRNWRMLDFFLFNGSFGNIQGGVSLALADRQRAEIVEAISKRDSVVAGRLMEKHMRDKVKWFPVASKPPATGLPDDEAAAPVKLPSATVLTTVGRRRH